VSRLLRSIPLIWLVPLVVSLLGCRTIGSDPWRSAQTEAPLETTASLPLAEPDEPIAHEPELPLELPEDIDAELATAQQEVPLVRDFTAVVDIAPTANSDGARIYRFSCTKAFEPKYEVEGVGIAGNPAFGFGTTSSVVKAVLPEWTPDSSLPLALGGPTGRSSWGADAKLRRAPRRR
jgi:hypothetical protein